MTTRNLKELGEETTLMQEAIGVIKNHGFLSLSHISID